MSRIKSTRPLPAATADVSATATVDTIGRLQITQARHRPHRPTDQRICAAFDTTMRAP